MAQHLLFYVGGFLHDHGSLAVPVNSSESRPKNIQALFLRLVFYPFALSMSMTIVKLNRQRLWGCFSFWAPTKRPDRPLSGLQICQRAVFFVFSCCWLLLLLIKYVLRILRCRHSSSVQPSVCPSVRLAVLCLLAALKLLPPVFLVRLTFMPTSNQGWCCCYSRSTSARFSLFN